ncbi:MAG TPA: hypothetical protein VK753_09555 [Xanthomonadaceae bacterium]|jgi:hypothetical protein|nr:hypothetical protein [Xanthomonadaceae bacterium]
MAELPPLMRDQRAIDADHLRLLRIFHFVAAGMAMLGLLFLLANFAMFRAFMDDPQMWNGRNQPPPAEFFAMFKWFYVVFGLWFLASGIVNVASGIFIGRRKHRTFSLVAAAFDCLNMPLGTVLGVFTMMVLLRDSVRETYET